MTATMTPDQAIAEYIKLRDLNAEIEKKSKELKAHNRQRMDEIEKLFLTVVFPAIKQYSTSGTTGSARREIKRRVNAKDWTQVYKFIAEDPEERISMLQKRFNTDNALECLDWSDLTETLDPDDIVEGFDLFDEEVVTFSSATSAAAKVAVARELKEAEDKPVTDPSDPSQFSV